MQEDYGEGLDANSHGEGFLKLFNARFTGAGVYLLDEPEAPLSPTRQLTLLSMMAKMVRKGAQFIIATHSPILMAYPNATLYRLGTERIAPIAYEDTEHYTITRDFLNSPDRFFKTLFRAD